MMNIEQVKKMTNQELRIKVAELCGWERGPNRDIKIGQYGLIPEMSCWHMKTDNDGWQDNVPNYPNDLNAMYEAEKSLKGQVKNSDLWMDELYVRKLVEVIGCTPLSRTNLVKATARQRAEAFVLTMDNKE